MKDHSPLVPQGSFEAQARGKSRVKFAFYTIVVIHVLAIAGFLIIGCKREDKDTASNTSTPTNDTTPVFDPSVISPAITNTNPPVGGTTTGLAATGNTAPPVPPPIVPTAPPSNPPPTPTIPNTIGEAQAATEHTIVKGDTFATLSTKYGVSVKNIQAANPGVDPTKLRIGQKVKIPPKTTMARNGGSGSSGTGIGAIDSGDTYTVKSGDTLSRIASNYHTTAREIQKLNGLSTTQIKVGQKLKVPSRAGALPGAAASSGTAVPAAGTPPPAQ